MKVLIFGTGDYYHKYKKWFINVDIMVLLDNNPQKQGQKLDGIDIVSPEEGIKIEYDAIFILSVHEESMRTQLLQLGVSENIIYKFSDIPNCKELLKGKKGDFLSVNQKDIQRVSSFGKDTILLMSHNMDLNGATLALYYMAKILKEQNYKVLFVSGDDGELKEHLQKEEIPYIIDQNLQVCTYEEISWVHQFDKIICNTLNYYYFLSNRDEQKNIIWWLHDPVMFYQSLDLEVLQKISDNNLYIYAVGKISEEALKTYKPQFKVEQLVYGIPDCEHLNCKKEDKDKIEFITIGNIQEYKGQDILLSAIKKIPESYYKKVHFTILGNQQSLFAARIIEDSREINDIVTFLSPVGREGIHNILSKSDVLICPSRVDTMSIVTTEAMMHELPCLVSKATGISVYIEDGYDGILIPNEDADYLAKKIMWCVEQKDDLIRMGKKSRMIYEKYFSMEIFKKNILDMMKRVYKI